MQNINHTTNPRFTPKPHTSGFSIVEVLVAGALLGIAVIAVVAVMQKSGDLQAAGSKRLAARVFLATQFEEQYGAGKYALTVPVLTVTDTVFGDPASPVTGQLRTSIIDSTVNQLRIRRVMLTLAWTEIDNSNDTITLMKWLAE